jgi:Protein of unknown function (DUF2924)
VRIGPAPPDREALDVAALRSRWHAFWGQSAPLHLPRHLLFRVLAYRLQADHWGDLDAESKRLLDRSESPEQAGQNAFAPRPENIELRPGTVLSREWNGQMKRVAVRDKGFDWNGKTYQSLSKVALAITGTRWNGPRFFGLRDNPRKGSSAS